MTMTIGELAAKGGVTSDAVRFYEREGLLPRAARTAAGYRTYEEEIVRRLRFIKGVQRFGVRLREIKELLEVLDRGACPCGHAERLVRERLSEVDTEIQRLAETRAELGRFLDRLPRNATPDPATGRWPCEIQFTEKGGATHDRS